MDLLKNDINFTLILNKLRQNDISKLNALSKKLNINFLNLLILLLRDYTTVDTIQNSFNDNFYKIIQDLNQISDIQDSANIIIQAIKQNKTILLWGDYDVDGTMGTTILYKYLQAVKRLNLNSKFKVFYHIPDRFAEGYGLNQNMLDKLYNIYKYDVLVTIDSGITNLNEIKHIKQNYNVDTIVIDHHTISDSEIFKYAKVINHRREDDIFFNRYQTPFCGAGLAYLFSLYLNEQLKLLSLNEMDKYSVYAAIATIADVVPLVNYNRVLVRQGFKLLNDNTFLQKEIPQLYYMKDILNIKQINSDEIAFKIAPVLNAVGRLSKANQIVDLFVTNNQRDINSKINYFVTLNNERKSKEKEILELIYGVIDLEKIAKEKRIIAVGNNWHKGVIGIVAGKLANNFNVPTIILSKDNDGTCTASCRSIEGFDLYEAIKRCSFHLEKFGGHEQAAGLTIKYENLKEFVADFTNITSKIPVEISTKKTYETDVLLSPDYFLDVKNILSLHEIEPFGNGFTKPSFGAKGKVVDIQSIGKSNNHYTVRFENFKIKANLFNYYDDINKILNKEIAFTYYPQLDTFKYAYDLRNNGTATLEGYIIIDQIFEKPNYVIQDLNISDKLNNLMEEIQNLDMLIVFK
ncbi:single-strand DNA-specific exonuclease (plasmid) [Deferribacter desulfuricans SSM1]|uniref:Single-stranded-DNA-specific exonuclease RecJ n=1 Tax=Deferribacter desulfuricans (strain DSM 14783 / JCM 11476 / NBRC 101012 / SSM1) TaxID=639282 RepID=D3PF51_DEFDS|nr:DHHA1 domain-containing protein [Deferribacter desulfuricans]BAI81843.1 single-strand DNA-specific exonuclease [Deferribacter desulfuricans SSM1]